MKHQQKLNLKSKQRASSSLSFDLTLLCMVPPLSPEKQRTHDAAHCCSSCPADFAGHWEAVQQTLREISGEDPVRIEPQSHQWVFKVHSYLYGCVLLL